ncbi:uncharacterized protein V6R79_006697 [Siganus canaliculatus]
MKMMLGLLLVAWCVSDLTEGRALVLDSCSISVHTQELRKYYSTLRENAITGESEIGVRLLDKSLTKDVQNGQMCCFLRLVLRFYIERVFSNFASSQAQDQRCASALANAFVSIRKQIHSCHCQCAEGTQRKVDSLQAEFDKLSISQAAQKAVGELDTVLEWLEAVGHNMLS